MFKRAQRFRVKATVLGTLCFMCVLLITTSGFHPFLIIRDIGYLTRPIWDKPGQFPEVIIPHYHAASVPAEELCELHGWKLRTGNKPKVIDAIIISNELDLLEIRMKELWEVVDKFLVLEADRTFTGKRKPLFLKDNLDRFEWAKDKLVAVALENELNESPKSDFENEVFMRKTMTGKVNRIGAKSGDLIIVGDTDEIPYMSTIQLLKACDGFPQELHLQMQNYLYSFEFRLDTTNWKPHVTVYFPNKFFYHHHKQASSNHQLADAGWHCSFCFRYISEFIFKMTSYSHNDRVTSKSLLKKESIQQRICDGADIFNMYPEAYTFKELFGAIGNIPKRLSTIGIPSHIVENPQKFRYLLPGGCEREDFRDVIQE